MANRRVTDGHVAVLGQRIRVKVRAGFGVPLVLCNGIGASLDVLDPLVAHLDRNTTVVRFDAPAPAGHRILLCRTDFRTWPLCWPGC